MIIYVNEYGAAHTVDQAHELAIQINALIDSGLGQKVKVLIDALWKVAHEIAGAFLKIWNGIKKIASDFVEMLLQPKKENYRQWQQREQKRKNRGPLRMYMKNKFNGTRPTDHARFNRSSRKG